MRNYRDNWFNVGAALAVVIAGVLALSHRRISRQRLFSARNLAALGPRRELAVSLGR